MSTIFFYRCCEHCCDECRYSDHHETACADKVYEPATAPGQPAVVKVCEEGREQVEVVTP
jgi:hypothetical protein